VDAAGIYPSASVLARSYIVEVADNVIAQIVLEVLS
jgi:hypothetical protein